MNVEFDCPGCQQSLSADVPATGVDVTCPACNTAFHVDAPAASLPTVKARVASVPVTPVAKSPANRPGPHAPAGAPARSRQPVKKASSGDGKIIATIVGLGLLLAGGGYGLWVAASKADEKQKAVTAAPSMQEQARQKMAELALKDATRRESDAKERDVMIAKNREEIAKREKEDAARLARERDEEITKIADEYFRGDKIADEYFRGDKIAGAEFLKEVEVVNAEINKLFADKIEGNEPGTRAEFRELWNRLFAERMKSNPVIAKARAGAMQDFLSEAPGQGFTKNAELLEKYNAFGSGFFISPDGWFITNRHVVRNAENVDLRISGEKIVPAKVVARDPNNDLALLKADVQAPAWLPIPTNGKELELGNTVFTIGFPNPVVQGLEPKYTDGRISSQAGMMDDTGFYQISVPVQPGNSGGPLIDMESGFAVGVITLRLDRTADGRAADNVSYALKGSVLHKFVSGTPEVAHSMKNASYGNPKDSAAIVTRARGSAATVLVPN